MLTTYSKDDPMLTLLCQTQYYFKMVHRKHGQISGQNYCKLETMKLKYNY